MTVEIGIMANQLLYGDNLDVSRHSIASESVDLVYLDPPFNSQAFFLLKARHGYDETDNRTKVSVDVAVNSVLVVPIAS
jgi:16S rRNA G966 N2-methylase RsmD